MNTLSPGTPQFLEQLETILRTFDCNSYPAENMPRDDWEKLVKAGVLLPIIPAAFGGRESHEEMCHIIRRAAFYNVSLAIYLNITALLFIRNLVNHGSHSVQQEFFEALFDHAVLGGIAITDPVSGSDPTLMNTWYEKVAGGYQVTGRKHWQAFSKTADWWLIVARDKQAGADSNTFNCFIHKRADGGFNTLQQYAPVGIRLIDYGLNEIAIFIPDDRRLEIDDLSFTGLLALIGAAGSQWAAIGCGFLERIYAEAVVYMQSRKTATGTLMDLGYVQYRLGNIAASAHVCKALFSYVLHRTDCISPVIKDVFVVRAVKVLASDLMLTAALHYQQLCGGEGYRYDAPGNIAAYALQDARGFSILGGSNDMLYASLCNVEHASELLPYLEEYQPALEKIPASHAEMVLYGKILARLFGISTITLYSAELQLTAKETAAAIALCRVEIAGILAELSAATAIIAGIEKK